MKTRQERTTGLLAFVRTVEAGSFSAAARLAGTTPSAVSKNVERLEKRLGVKLFLRSTRSLSLTVDGTAYYERVAPLLRALDDADEALEGAGRASGLLRVSIPAILGVALVDALTRDFVTRYPDIKLEISISDRHVDLVREGFDVALRTGQVADSDWIVRPLGNLPLALVASPVYLDRAGHPQSIEELGQAAHIRYMLGARAYPIAFANGEILNPAGVFDSDSGQAMRTAALNGLGIAQLLRFAVEDDLKAGRLIQVMPDYPLALVPAQALHAFGRFPPLRIRLFTDFVAETMAAHIVKR
jgi:DNA-binding transcriptional LysR family regulator